jgi:hypothetical protein
VAAVAATAVEGEGEGVDACKARVGTEVQWLRDNINK